MCDTYKYVKILFADEVGALVFDVGSYSFRAGYAGEDCPKVVLLYMVAGLLYCIMCLFHPCVPNLTYINNVLFNPEIYIHLLYHIFLIFKYS